jgi:alkylation response protein AidB-like acyl-CoA dehydrogenase
MTTVAGEKNVLKGGEFIIKDCTVEDTFIPEELNEEQEMIRKMCLDFLENEILPNAEKIEAQQDDIAPQLVKKMGDMGLLGTHMPESYGGMALDTNTNTLICDVLGPSGSFTVSFAAHTGIGMLPILYFGTEEQKEKYLPGLITGDLKACYCLTEPGSGSDALAAKTRADLSEDGKTYVLNGQKMWISNAGFADIFIVFAKVGGEKFTGFIVERDTPGLTLGAEEKKLGIKGSSTRQVFFDNASIPAENVLGEIGKGHHIAFNVLNIGRFKLAALCMGGAKRSITTAVKYANERYQFAQPIANFGAIQYKLAEQVIRNFAVESATYRVSNLLEEAKNSFIEQGMDYAKATLEAAEEYSIECSILKVAGSEVLDYVVDETVQIHGGIGYSEEYSPARAYRDSRINRIYEGTNEINRLLMVDMLLRKALKGELDLIGPAWAVQKELASMPSMSRPEGTYGEEDAAIKDFKKILLMVAGAAAKQQMDGQLNLKEEQEILMNVSDIMIDTYLAESILTRIKKLEGRETKVDQSIYSDILHVFMHDAQARIAKNALDALASFAEGDLLKVMTMGLKRFTKYPTVNVKLARRNITAVMREHNEYCF